MALDLIDYTAGQDSMTDVFDKANAGLTKVNEIDANLPGGSTNQILRKTSNDNYDYEWVNPQDISGKLDSSKILTEYISEVGPDTYLGGAETIMLTLVPSASKSSTKMKYTFMGYVINGGGSTIGSTLKIKKNGTEMCRTISSPDSGSQQNFCLIWYDTYTAGDSITATALASGDQNLNYYILICESLDAV